MIKYHLELSAAHGAMLAGNAELAFHHLERAHILSQRHTVRHMYVHWLMLRLGFSTCDWQELFGQVTRVLAAALFSRIWVPIGNTGRANVSALQPMPVPEDLRETLEESSWR